MRPGQDLERVRFLHIPVQGDHMPDPWTDLLDLDPARHVHIAFHGVDQAHEDDLLAQHPAASQQLKGTGGRETRGAVRRDEDQLPRREGAVFFFQRLRQVPFGPRNFQHVLHDDGPSLVPGQHEDKKQSRHQNGKISTLRQLRQAGDQKRNLHGQQHRGKPRGLPGGPFPAPAGDQSQRDGGDDHRSHHRQAVGGGQIVARTKGQHEKDTNGSEQKIRHRHIDLSALLPAGVHDEKFRQVTQLLRLGRERERSRNQGL